MFDISGRFYVNSDIMFDISGQVFYVTYDIILIISGSCSNSGCDAHYIRQLFYVRI